MLTVTEELAVNRLAVGRMPKSAKFRYRLAHNLFLLDQFDEAIELLRALDGEGDEFRVPHRLGTALMARETHADTIDALRAGARALDLAGDNAERARSLALLGKAQLRLGQFDAARRSLTGALDADIHNKDAYKRLAAFDFSLERIEAALEFANEMIARDVTHARVLGVVPLALAKLGRIEEAREAYDFNAYRHAAMLPPPLGWASIEGFNRDLAAELMAHPGIRYERYGVASTRTWRIDQPCLARSKLMPLLRQLLRDEAEAYISRLPANNHPWIGRRRASAGLHHWSIIADADGFEEWHVHQNGWVSGAYYVDVPDAIVKGDGPEGCIAFGLPEGIVGNQSHEAFGTLIVRPRSGLVMMFPSHSYHRTYAHRGDQRRICVAFDIAPDETHT